MNATRHAPAGAVAGQITHPATGDLPNSTKAWAGTPADRTVVTAGNSRSLARESQRECPERESRLRHLDSRLAGGSAPTGSGSGPAAGEITAAGSTPGHRVPNRVTSLTGRWR